MTDLRTLMDHLTHIDQGGRTIRELDPRTGRIVSRPVAEGETGRKIGSAIGGIFGKSAGDRLGQVGSDIGDFFGGPDSNKPRISGSDFSGGSQDRGSAAKPNFTSQGSMPAAPGGSQGDGSNKLEKKGRWNPPTAGQNADGSFNSDHPFVKAMDAKMARNRNPNSNNGHDNSGIPPDADPEDPSIWPQGVTKAPDFGYLDAQRMWIPTPFHVRDEDGDFNVPRKSPANLIGIPWNTLTPFQIKFDQMKNKVVYSSASAIEQTKPVKLPDGAPTIPGYTQVDASKFSTDAREPGLNKTVDWVYAYRKGNDFILIAPQLFYNTKISIGRHYDNWVGRGLRTDDDRVPSKNGTVFVAAQSFNVNDMILSVVVHTSMGAGNIGPQILKSISRSLTPV
jgi:hypothetical protein